VPLTEALQCPDGVDAAFVTCTSNEDCKEFVHLSCLPIEGEDEKYCCGPAKVAQPPDPQDPGDDGTRPQPPDSDEDESPQPPGGDDEDLPPEPDDPQPEPPGDEPSNLKCPDGIISVARCAKQSECDGFNLKCTEIVKGHSFCCSKADSNAPTPDDPQPGPGDPIPPSQPRTCQDSLNVKECTAKKHLCDLEVYNKLMRKHCIRTCDMCTNSQCVDMLPNECKRKSGLCANTKYTAQMQKLCKKTCKFCN